MRYVALSEYKPCVSLRDEAAEALSVTADEIEAAREYWIDHPEETSMVMPCMPDGETPAIPADHIRMAGELYELDPIET